jgi:hypothetical protein
VEEEVELMQQEEMLMDLQVQEEQVEQESDSSNLQDHLIQEFMQAEVEVDLQTLEEQVEQVELVVVEQRSLLHLGTSRNS